MSEMRKFNVNLSDSDYANMGALAGLIDGTMADVIREAIGVFLWIAIEHRAGHTIVIRRPNGESCEVVLPSLFLRRV